MAEYLDEVDTKSLLTAVQYGDLVKVKDLISQNRISPQSQDSEGCFMLHWAAINNRYEISKLLIAGGADVNSAGGILQEIPLQWAVRNTSFTQLVRLLIEKGSNLGHRNTHGHDALHIACQLGHATIAFILLYHGANVDSLDLRGNTPLYWLLSEKSEVDVEAKRQLIMLLLSFGANVLHRGYNGATAFHIIVTGGIDFDPYVALLVLEKGGASNVLSCCNHDNLTPVELCKRLKKEDKIGMTQFLFDAEMYLNWPRWVPTAMAALSTFTFFALLHYVGVWGLVGFLAVLAASERFGQVTILKGKGRRSNGWAWGVICSIVWSYFTFVSGHGLPLYWDFAISVLAVLIFFTIFKAATTRAAGLEPHIHKERLLQRIVATGIPDGLYDTRGKSKEGGGGGGGGAGDSNESPSPAHPASATNERSLTTVTSNSGADNDAEEKDAQLDFAGSDGAIAAAVDSSDTGGSIVIVVEPSEDCEQPARLCTTCMTDKSQASTHCSKCDFCVVALDHHCDFVDNCVGRGNRRVFVLFTLTASFGCALYSFLAFWVQYTSYCPDAEGVLGGLFAVQTCVLKRSIAFWAATWLAVFASAWIGCIGIGQIGMIATETTTYDMLKGRHDGSCTGRHWLRNILTFFRTGYYNVRTNPRRRGGGHGARKELDSHSPHDSGRLLGHEQESDSHGDNCHHQNHIHRPGSNLNSSSTSSSGSSHTSGKRGLGWLFGMRSRHTNTSSHTSSSSLPVHSGRAGVVEGALNGCRDPDPTSPLTSVGGILSALSMSSSNSLFGLASKGVGKSSMGAEYDSANSEDSSR